MTGVAMLEAVAREYGTTHPGFPAAGVSDHPVPMTGCPWCIDGGRAAAVQTILDAASPTVVDTYRGTPADYPARVVLAAYDLGVVQGIITAGTVAAPELAPRAGSTVPCGITDPHEEHPYKRIYRCKGL